MPVHGAQEARFGLEREQSQGAVPEVLTPARLRQPQSETPASVTVIDQSMIRASGAREIFELFRLVPGMSVAKSDGNVPSVVYHGTQARDSRRMLVLVDGRSLYMSGLARVLWNDFPISIEDVERIEVTRGPASASYGANAFVGVINIITRHPRDISGTRVETRQGNNGIEDYLVRHAGQGGQTAWRVTAEQRADDGYDGDFDPDYGDHPERDARRINLINTRITHEPSLQDTVELLAGGSDTFLERPKDAGFEDFSDYRELPDDESERAFLQLRWKRQVSPTHSLEVGTYAQYAKSAEPRALCMRPIAGDPALGGLFFSRELRDVFLSYLGREDPVYDTEQVLESSLITAAGGTPPPGSYSADPALVSRIQTLATSGISNPLCADFDFSFQEERYDIEVEDTVYFNEDLRLVSGVNLRQDRVSSDTYINGTETNFSARIFGNIEARLNEALLVNLGGYWEDDEINGRYFSPRAALIIKPTANQSLRAVYSEAVRTPDIYEKNADVHLRPMGLSSPYANNAQSLLGWSDPEFFITQASDGSLEAEEIRSRELGYYGHFSSFEIDVRFFEEELRELISEALSPFDFEPANKDRVDIRGWETQLTWRPAADHMLRLTNAHIHHRASLSTERRFSPRDSGSLLYSFDVTDNTLVSVAGYLAHDYNKWEYERADFNLRQRVRLGRTDLNLGFTVQRLLLSNPIVFEENRYKDQKRYWLSASLDF
jgi:iron complex outermembrane receptor protein